MSYTLSNPLPAAELARALDRRTALHLIDVRTVSEFDRGHIAGSQNVPLGDLGQHAERLAQLLGAIVLVCRSGARAYAAERLLRQAGARRVHVLDGGVLAWRHTGNSLVSDPALAGGFLRKMLASVGMTTRAGAR